MGLTQIARSFSQSMLEEDSWVNDFKNTQENLVVRERVVGQGVDIPIPPKWKRVQRLNKFHLFALF